MEELIEYQKFTNKKWLAIVLCFFGGMFGWHHWMLHNNKRAWTYWILTVVFSWTIIAPIYTFCKVYWFEFWRILDANCIEDLENCHTATVDEDEDDIPTEENDWAIWIVVAFIIAIAIMVKVFS